MEFAIDVLASLIIRIAKDRPPSTPWGQLPIKSVRSQ